MKKVILLFFLIFIGIVVGFYISQNRSENSSQENNNNNSNQKKSVISQGRVPDINFNLSDQYAIHTFAEGLGKPRDLIFTQNGTLLVSIPDQNKAVALPDKNGDGVADAIKPVLTGQNKPHGLAFYNGQLFVAGVDRVVRYNFDENNLTASGDRELFSLSNNKKHDKRSILITSQGQVIVSVPSSCNVCHEDLLDGGSVVISDINGGKPKIYAQGLRNAAFMVENPKTGQIWVSEMGRDNLGDDIPPDEINILEQGKDYGWPKCYGDKVWDKEFNKVGNGTCRSTIAPIYKIPAHAAPLGLVFIDSNQFPADWQGDLLVAYHGSWNRSTPAGFKIVKLDVAGSTIIASEDFLTGFLADPTSDDSALARPADLVFDKLGNLYFSDDKSGNIYIIQKK